MCYLARHLHHCGYCGTQGWRRKAPLHSERSHSTVIPRGWGNCLQLMTSLTKRTTGTEVAHHRDKDPCREAGQCWTLLGWHPLSP